MVFSCFLSKWKKALPVLSELRERAEEVLRHIREGTNRTDFADAIATLPVDMIVKFGTVTADPYVIVRCRNGFEPVSTSLCAAPLGEEIPILGSCLGAATFDRETGSCFTVSEVVESKPLGLVGPKHLDPDALSDTILY